MRAIDILRMRKAKVAITYNPPPDFYNYDTSGFPVDAGITASSPTKWTYTLPPFGIRSSVANGATASSIIFSADQGASGSVNVTAGDGSQWTLNFGNGGIGS